MKVDVLRKKSEKELTELLKKERAHIGALHFQSAKGRNKDVKSQKAARRVIARILTLLQEQAYESKK